MGARRRGLRSELSRGGRGGSGQGAEGFVDGRRVAVGSESWLETRGYPVPAGRRARARRRERRRSGEDLGRSRGQAGRRDRHGRPSSSRRRQLVEDLREAGIRHVAMATGDRAGVADEIGREVGVDRVYAEQTPEEKLELVRSIQQDAGLCPVVMVGDGVNDAPALALADVGIAMGTAGATVASETADAVILVDRIGRVADALRIGRRSLSIARQSVLAGIGLSLVAMGVRRLRLHPARLRRAPPGGDRRGGHPQCAPSTPRLSRPLPASTCTGCRSAPGVTRSG